MDPSGSGVLPNPTGESSGQFTPSDFAEETDAYCCWFCDTVELPTGSPLPSPSVPVPSDPAESDDAEGAEGAAVGLRAISTGAFAGIAGILGSAALGAVVAL